MGKCIVYLSINTETLTFTREIHTHPYLYKREIIDFIEELSVKLF